MYLLSTCYVPDNPWLASSHSTSRDQGQVGANEVGSILFLHHTGLSELRGKKQQQPTIYNLAWRDAHARTTQESHLARATRDPRKVRRAPSTANRLVQHIAIAANLLADIYLYSVHYKHTRTHARTHTNLPIGNLLQKPQF